MISQMQRKQALASRVPRLTRLRRSMASPLPKANLMKGAAVSQLQAVGHPRRGRVPKTRADFRIGMYDVLMTRSMMSASLTAVASRVRLIETEGSR